MDIEQIKQIIPHRDNMLLIDEAEVKDGVAYGKKHITGDEWFLQGHFPGNPVVPGVILCEIMAQSSCVLLADQADGATPYFTGDTIETECRITRSKGPFYFAEGKASVNGKLCVSASFSFALIK